MLELQPPERGSRPPREPGRHRPAPSGYGLAGGPEAPVKSRTNMSLPLFPRRSGRGLLEVGEPLAQAISRFSLLCGQMLDQACLTLQVLRGALVDESACCRACGRRPGAGLQHSEGSGGGIGGTEFQRRAVYDLEGIPGEWRLFAVERED